MNGYFIKRVLPASALTLCVALGSCSKKKDNEESSAPRSVQVAEAFTDSVVLYKTLPGMITTASETNVVARVNGNIIAQHFTGGQYVKKGQVLYTIESDTYRDAVQQAEAALASARSQYDYYSQQLTAMERALEANAVSKMQVVQAQSSKDQAAASIKTAQAALSTARTNLSHCTVTAPSSGYISEGIIDAGNYVSGEAEAVTLATIYDNSDLQARFSISDTEYETLMGQTGGLTDSLYRNVPLTFRDSLKNNYTTNLFYESPSVDESTASLNLIGTVTNRDNELKNGMYVSVSLPYGVEPHAILVKDASLGSDQLGYYLFTVDDNDEVHQTPVQVGDLYHDSLRIVNSGIRAGQKYVTKALLNVRSGEKVKPVLTK
ncbi:MAG: efflux RND transporter periplasmic adaptor subunit [Bacteroidales bacterium]|nr:efflux RND transporter periplasmic adaptor subunit [Bacteroidales bacterium]